MSNQVAKRGENTANKKRKRNEIECNITIVRLSSSLARGSMNVFSGPGFPIRTLKPPRTTAIRQKTVTKCAHFIPISRFSFSSISSTDSVFFCFAADAEDEFHGLEYAPLVLVPLEVLLLLLVPLAVLPVLVPLVLLLVLVPLEVPLLLLLLPSFFVELFALELVLLPKMSKPLAETSGAASSRKSTNSSPSASSSSHKLLGFAFFGLCDSNSPNSFSMSAQKSENP
jgi:hypothetical protein